MHHDIQLSPGEGLVPPGLRAEEFKRLFEVVEAHAQARRTYRPGTPSGRAVLLRASEPLRVALPEGRPAWARALGRLSRSLSAPPASWEKWLPAGIEIESVPGDHFTVLEEPRVRALAQHLNAKLEKAVRKS